MASAKPKMAKAMWDTKKLWPMDKDEIIATLKKLKTKSAADGVDPLAKNLGAKKKPQGETMSLHFVIDYIAHCSGVVSKGEAPGASEMIALSQYVALAAPPATTEKKEKKPSNGVTVSAPFFHGSGETRDYDVNFGNTQLPVRTVFDALGWVLSITATVDAEGPLTPSNFYLPLMGLYAKWCDTLMDGDYQPTMLHIAWWGQPGEEKVLLGATPGGEHSLFNPKLNGALKGSAEEGNLRDTDKARREAKKSKKDAAKAKLDNDAPGPVPGDSEETKKKKKEARKDAQDKMKTQDDIDAAKASEEASALETRYEGFRGLDVLGVRQDELKKRGVNPPAGEEGQTLEALLTTKLKKKLDDPNADDAAKEKIVDDLDNKMFEEGNTGYGRCAETFIYLVMGAEREDVGDSKLPKVRGFATSPIVLNNEDWYAKEKPDLTILKKQAFAAPCDSCKAIIKQFPTGILDFSSKSMKD